MTSDQGMTGGDGTGSAGGWRPAGRLMRVGLARRSEAAGGRVPAGVRPGSPDREARLAAWEKREAPMIAVLPYLMLTLTFAVTAFIKAGQPGSLLIDLALCASAAGWMLWMFTLHPEWRENTAVMAVFFVGLEILATVLIVRDPWFGFFTFTGYFYVFVLPVGLWRQLGVFWIALLTGTSQSGGFPGQHTSDGLMIWLIVVGVNVAIASAFTWFGWVSSEQNDLRKQAVAELSEANSKLEQTLAENAGLHQQLVTQAREAGILDERQRMAREIHDTMAQGLTGIIAQLQAAEQAGREEDRKRRMQAAITLARESLSEARRSVHELRPEPLETARLGDALAEVTGRWTQLHGVPVTLSSTGRVRPLPPETEVTLLRAAQEALANVARHASAQAVWLTLSYIDDEVVLDVRDDGVGFDPSALARAATAKGGGFGLTAMRQRVEALSGTLEIESEPGSGTAVSVCLPVQFDQPARPALPADRPESAPAELPTQPAAAAEPATAARPSLLATGPARARL
ncbi:MAG TPA: sensor histidine kinase [Streptosporangiaceae bacterium]